MKVFETHPGRYDVYFKTEDSGNQFVNFLYAVSGRDCMICSIAYFSNSAKERGVYGSHLYTLPRYIEESVITSYLELFPEEKE